MVMKPGLFCRCVILGLILLFIPAQGRAAEWGWSLSLNGAAETAAVEWYAVGRSEAETTVVELTRLRGGGRAWWGRQAVFEAAYELNALSGRTRAGPGLEMGSLTGLRLVDLEGELISKEDFSLGQNLDRFNLTLSLPKGVLILGRQAISHGSARFFNPTDIFAPLTPYSTYTEYKAGVDALRLSLPFGENVEMEVFGVGQEDGLEEGILLGRGHFLLPGVDLSFLAGVSYGEPTLALDLSGDLGGAGWYAEAITRPGGEKDGNFRATAGLQYHFAFGLDALAEVHYNGLGENDVDHFSAVYQTLEWRHHVIFLLGQWFSVVSLDHVLHPLLHANLLWLQSYTDGSLLLQPALKWDITAAMTLKGGASLGLGPRPRAAPDPLDPSNELVLPRSEFGAYPNIYYVEISFNF